MLIIFQTYKAMLAMRKLFSSMLTIALIVGASTNVFAKDYKIAVTDIQGLDALISEWGPF